MFDYQILSDHTCVLTHVQTNSCLGVGLEPPSFSVLVFVGQRKSAVIVKRRAKFPVGPLDGMCGTDRNDVYLWQRVFGNGEDLLLSGWTNAGKRVGPVQCSGGSRGARGRFQASNRLVSVSTTYVFLYMRVQRSGLSMCVHLHST